MPFPIDIKYILETEDELGIEFPEQFKKKMIFQNGGEILTVEDTWQLFPFFDKSDRNRIRRTCNHIIVETEEAKECNNFPENAIAIATNGLGDNLILLPSEKNSRILKEEIYLWLHETGEVIEIAKTITDLTEEN